jgi:hypothetical protein
MSLVLADELAYNVLRGHALADLLGMEQEQMMLDPHSHVGRVKHILNQLVQ